MYRLCLCAAVGVRQAVFMADQCLQVCGCIFLFISLYGLRGITRSLFGLVCLWVVVLGITDGQS